MQVSADTFPLSWLHWILWLRSLGAHWVCASPHSRATNQDGPDGPGWIKRSSVHHPTLQQAPFTAVHCWYAETVWEMPVASTLIINLR